MQYDFRLIRRQAVHSNELKKNKHHNLLTYSILSKFSFKHYALAYQFKKCLLFNIIKKNSAQIGDKLNGED